MPALDRTESNWMPEVIRAPAWRAPGRRRLAPPREIGPMIALLASAGVAPVDDLDAPGQPEPGDVQDSLPVPSGPPRLAIGPSVQTWAPKGDENPTCASRAALPRRGA